jgi:5-(carboxyamino)imidazole ribonucleotide mutase
LNGAKNAGILAATIIGAFDPLVGGQIIALKKKLETEVLQKVGKLKKEGWQNGFDEGD